MLANKLSFLVDDERCSWWWLWWFGSSLFTNSIKWIVCLFVTDEKLFVVDIITLGFWLFCDKLWFMFVESFLKKKKYFFWRGTDMMPFVLITTALLKKLTFVGVRAQFYFSFLMNILWKWIFKLSGKKGFVAAFLKVIIYLN